MDTPITESVPLHVRIDPQLDAELRDTMEREERKKTAVVERALRDYIAKSKAEAARTNSRKPAQVA